MHKEMLDLLKTERQETQKGYHQGLNDERQALLQLLGKMQEVNRNNITSFSEIQGRVFEEALEKIAIQYYQLERDIGPAKGAAIQNEIFKEMSVDLRAQQTKLAMLIELLRGDYEKTN